MKGRLLVLLFTMLFSVAFAQKQTFDIISYTAPTGWKMETASGSVSYTIANKQKGSWCRINIIKSVPSLGDIDKDFTDDWQQLLVKPYNVSNPAGEESPKEIKSWKVKSAAAKFTFNNADAAAMLTTISGYNTRVAIVALTNTQDYVADIEKLLASLDLKIPTTTPVTTNNPSPDYVQKKEAYAFTTTTFDDGWASAIQADWVEVKKGEIKVLLHYPRPMKSHVVFPANITTAWDTLVSLRYNALRNFKTTYINSYKYTDIAMGTVLENSTNASKFVVLFRQAGGGWIEVIAPDKAGFVQTFGFDPEAVRWDSDIAQTEVLANMISRNKFAVSAKDLYGTGEWRQRYSSNTFWSNYYTGSYEGMSTYSASQWFVFGKGQGYTWSLVTANSYGGRTNFASAKGAGTFNSPNNWQLYFTDIEGKPKTFDAYYTAVKGGRVLWLNDARYPGSGVFTGYERK